VVHISSKSRFDNHMMNPSEHERQSQLKSRKDSRHSWKQVGISANTEETNHDDDNDKDYGTYWLLVVRVELFEVERGAGPSVIGVPIELEDLPASGGKESGQDALFEAGREEDGIVLAVRELVLVLLPEDLDRRAVLLRHSWTLLLEMIWCCVVM